MNNKLRLLSIIIFNILLFSNCETVEQIELSREELVCNKWMVDAISSEFKWFEFTSDNLYIISKSNSDFIYGNYRFEGDIIRLENIGMIEIVELSQDNFDFIFREDDSTIEHNILSVSIYDELNNENNDKIAHLWNVDKIGDSDVPNQGLNSVKIIFTKKGTYLIIHDYVEYQSEMVDYYEWEWQSESEDKIYLYKYGTEIVENKFSITSLESTKLEYIDKTNTQWLLMRIKS